jgi:sugar transferase (PEP-CTERM/EpsH1 system associated)
MSMPIRIMHIVDSLAVGGLQNGLANLIDRMDMTRFEHVVCAMRPIDEANAQRFSPGRARVMGLSMEESASRFQVGALARRIRAVEPDIVHTRNWGTSEGLLAARQVGACTRIHSEHGIDWDTTTKEPWRRILFRRLAFQLADRVVSVSYQLRDLHARRTGFPARKITVIHNGVDSRRFFPDVSVRARVRRELGLGEDEFCIGCVGNLIPVKDHITLLKAVDGLAKCGLPWRLLIAGDGPEFSKLTEFVNSHSGWKDRVTFLGRSSSVPELLNAMDVYVSSSLTEGISNSVLEAMATGLPVVVTATGGNPEVVVDGESGLLFPVGDCLRLADHLRSLEAQRELRIGLGQQALRRVRDEFSIDSMVGNYTRIYENYLAVGAAPMRTVARA